jgi:hypothetical protein
VTGLSSSLAWVCGGGRVFGGQFVGIKFWGWGIEFYLGDWKTPEFWVREKVKVYEKWVAQCWRWFLQIKETSILPCPDLPCPAA